MSPVDLAQITIDALPLPILEEKKITVSVLRLDKIHPFISGNKWFKLKYWLEDARSQGKKHIVTFGGAWSNHILATAAASRLFDMHSTGIIRGEEPAELSSILKQAREWGMQLVFSSRDDYKHKKLPKLFSGSDYYIIPEGGYGSKGVEGAATIADFFSGKDFTHIACAVGTGTMMAGLIRASDPAQKIIGIHVLKGNPAVEKEIETLLEVNRDNYELIPDYHFGGYAKYTPELIAWMNDCWLKTNIPTDFVYTGKLFFAVSDLAQKDFFPAGSRILLIHSGGLPGNSSLEKGTLMF